MAPKAKNETRRAHHSRRIFKIWTVLYDYVRHVVDEFQSLNLTELKDESLEVWKKSLTKVCGLLVAKFSRKLANVAKISSF